MSYTHPSAVFDAFQLIPVTRKLQAVSFSSLILTLSTIGILRVGWNTYLHSQRDRGTVPRAPHLIPWIGNLKALLLYPVAWPWQTHEKLVSTCQLAVYGNVL